MAKPVFSPSQYELRNETPIFLSEEQQTKVSDQTSRVNSQLDFVAQILGWNGDNYWNTLASTVNQKRGLLSGTFGIYNSYTILPIFEIRATENIVVTEKRPNILPGQRVIIGNLQSFIYELTEVGEFFELNIGDLSAGLLALLQQGAALKVDVPENRPFPFYRPNPLASGDAEFRCTTGLPLPSPNIYNRIELVLYPYSQGNTVVPYENLQLFAGSYYYFDREVFIGVDNRSLIPWALPEFIQEKGLWKLYVCPELIGQQIYLVWNYPDGENDRLIATCDALVIPWKDPSDWGDHGDTFNPVLDQFILEKTFSISGLNYALGTKLWLSDNPPQTGNPLWYDAGKNVLYSAQGSDWVAIGSAVAFVSLDDSPPTSYDLTPGTIWQAPSGKLYVWDQAPPNPEWIYFNPDFSDGPIFYHDPTYQDTLGLYYYDPESIFILCPTYEIDGFYVHNTVINDEGFYVTQPCSDVPSWHEIILYDQTLFETNWTPSYASNLNVVINGRPIPNYFTTPDYAVNWEIVGDSLNVEYRALSIVGETELPQIVIRSNYGIGGAINITDDFKKVPDSVTVLPYNEIGVLNNFRGVWGNKGGARSMDLCFDALDIHGFNEREALWLAPISRPIDFDFLLSQVTANQIFIGDSPPQDPELGDYYYNNETGALSIYFEDADRERMWVEVDLPTPPQAFTILKPVLSTGSCTLNDGDMWVDQETQGVTIFYENEVNPDNWDTQVGTWVQVNWKYDFSQGPDPIPDFNSLQIYIQQEPDSLTLLTPGLELVTDDYTCSYAIDTENCAFIFNYDATSDVGLQQFPQWFVAPTTEFYFPQNISEYVYSDLRFIQAACVQNASSTLRPWKNQDLEVTTETELSESTFFNPLIADINKGAGDEDFLKSFIRLPSEYGRDSKKWQQAQLVMQDMAYFGSYNKLFPMRCPTLETEMKLYDEAFFNGEDPTGQFLYSESYLYSDAQGFNDPSVLLPESTTDRSAYQDADFDFVGEVEYDDWNEAGISEYAPLHYRQTDDQGNWQGIYVEPEGTQALSGFVEQDIAGKTVTLVAPPVWDASIYKYPPLCPFDEETYFEDANNYKVNYAYFSADLAAAEDGFFDPQSDVAWREPITKDQTLYTLRT